jgi:hypothetical protein
MRWINTTPCATTRKVFRRGLCEDGPAIGDVIFAIIARICSSLHADSNHHLTACSDKRSTKDLPALSPTQKNQKVSLLEAQVHSQSVLSRELGLQIMYLDDESFALQSVLTAQGRELCGIGTFIRG